MTKEICMCCRPYSGEAPTGYWMSEKHDGIRLIRQRGETTITTREGIPVYPPQWWMDKLPPSIFLDGEAWCGRRRFRLVQSIIESSMRKPGGDEWREVRLMVIEPLMSYAFENDVIFPIEQIVCRGRSHLQEFLSDVRSNGGEGVVLRHPRQKYHLGSSPYLLKLAPTQKELNAMRLSLEECCGGGFEVAA